MTWYADSLLSMKTFFIIFCFLVLGHPRDANAVTSDPNADSGNGFLFGIDAPLAEGSDRFSGALSHANATAKIADSTTLLNIVPKKYVTKKVKASIKIDGVIDEESWAEANIADKFIQLEPSEGAAVTQQSEVRVIFDDVALYVSAILYDDHPDSILHQMGNRDEGGSLNADAFRFGLDPYNRRENGYVFEVSASGVQTEYYDDDLTFDAVWESAVKINDKGWCVEMKIPYSALRFPAAKDQVWGIQFARIIRRNREYDQWTLTPKSVTNRMLYWGTMEGIHDIDPPLRLSVTPYFSVYGERAPVYRSDNTTGYQNSYSYSGGADLKYGIDERFTLDVTLLPDFSQVQSDNKVKNLSAFETIYEERRPFFKEGTSIFSKGNLFYSRRIGRTPKYFYSVLDSLNTGDVLIDNPDRARLVNATKLSGRTDGGLGIGVLNAITANTYAVIQDSTGQKRDVLTDPATNYNVLVFDQQLKNNSSVFVSNTNVIRNGKERDANVTTGQGIFQNKKHQYQLTGSFSYSQVYEWQSLETGETGKKKKDGEFMWFSADKIIGHSQYGATYEVCTKNYDRNDLGYIFVTNYSQLSSYYTFYKFNPFWKHFKQGNITFYANRTGRLDENNVLTSMNTGMNIFLLFNSNWSIYTETGFNPVNGRDYYEPRIPGRYFNTKQGSYGSLNFTTNYNRKLAFDFGGRYYFVPAFDYTALGYYIIPMVRVSDRFNIKLSNYFDVYNNDVGFAAFSAGFDSSYFGKRDIKTIENTLSARYLFKNDMSLTMQARHYWSKGTYERFYSLNTDGNITPVDLQRNQNYDFNSNYITVDLVYNWQFAPGSSFLVTFKNITFSDLQETASGYFDNLVNTFSQPQINSISLKVLYYLDYQYLKKKG